MATVTEHELITRTVFDSFECESGFVDRDGVRVAYRPVETDGAGRAAALIAELL
jgi:hypothetical protein